MCVVHSFRTKPRMASTNVPWQHARVSPCLSVRLSVCLSVSLSLSLSLSFRLSLGMSVCVSLYLFFLSVCSSVCLSCRGQESCVWHIAYRTKPRMTSTKVPWQHVRVSPCLSVRPSVGLSVCVSFFLSVCSSVCLSR